MSDDESESFWVRMARCQSLHPTVRDWFRKVSEGDVVPLRNIGTVCANGDLGCEETQEGAVHFWRIGAEAGDAVCQANLGSRLVQGYGVAMDVNEGLHYYVLSARQGHYAGIYGLAMCHENGEGIATNLDGAWRLRCLQLMDLRRRSSLRRSRLLCPCCRDRFDDLCDDRACSGASARGCAHG